MPWLLFVSAFDSTLHARSHSQASALKASIWVWPTVANAESPQLSLVTGCLAFTCSHSWGLRHEADTSAGPLARRACVSRRRVLDDAESSFARILFVTQAECPVSFCG